MHILELILPTLIGTVVSTGLITAFLSHLYDKKLRTHDIKIQNYFKLIGELAKFASNEADWSRLRVLLNEALLFASDEVVGEILEFNRKFTDQRQTATSGHFQMTASHLQPLIITMRADLYLKSNSIQRKGLVFFQKPRV